MKYIIDTDPGIDDAIAICMAVKNNLDSKPNHFFIIPFVDNVDNSVNKHKIR